ncbi:MAG: hypothetical protein ABIR80_11460, partial [Opitutaceae bacterium]
GLMLTEEEPYRVCIAIGYGPVLKNGEFGVMGDEMNLVANLAEDIAEGGDTLLSDAARRSLEVHAERPLEKRQLTISQVNVTYFRVLDWPTAGRPPFQGAPVGPKLDD